ncbi:ATP-dependent DNA helicase PIF1 [Apostasia shenzhenica]|uniref:ATP-dependent DNA helicase PIF1 n=1 Tax=Apostasia shenzhenica TaxID=1088818 RepID=A0A2I0ATY3_9ASPA|nr:ATP-dependent DNA helicase PIF1 [Apostasia shenzhenica]
MRLHINANNDIEKLEKFTKWIINVGDGKIEGIKLLDDNYDSTWIKISEDMLINSSEGLKGLIKEIYPNLNSKTLDPNYLKTRAILAPRNEEVDYINNIVLSEIKSDTKTYRSAHIIIPQNDEKYDKKNLYTPEFLNSLTLLGLPPHSLQLKINTSILLLRNLDQSRGLCNGTKLIVKNLGQRVIEAQITKGSNIQENIIIPRISMTSNQNDMSFILKRKQLPI